MKSILLKLIFLFFITGFFFSSCDVLNISTNKHPSNKQIENALKEALMICAQNTSNNLSMANSFNKNPYINIGFPQDFIALQNTLTTMGAVDRFDKLHTDINRCAENSITDILPFIQTEITRLEFANPRQTLFGSDSAMTNYLKDKSYTEILNSIQPSVKTNLDKMNITKDWESMLDTYNKVPYHKEVNPDLSDYISQKILDAFFYQMEEQEKAIRETPQYWKSVSLEKVFRYRKTKLHK